MGKDLIRNISEVTPEAVEDAVEPILEAHINAEEPHPAYDIDMPSLKVIFENNLL